MSSNMPPLFDVLNTTASGLQAQLAAGTLNSVQIVTTYLSQIEKHNHAGANLNAILTLAPKDLVLKQAEELDKERRERRMRGPLHGLPIIIKDCFLMGTELGMKTTAGAYCFADEKAKKNATVVTQLLEKGLIILGTTTLAEFCGHKAEKMSPCWSAYGGKTRSAYDRTSSSEMSIELGLASVCGGSSSGSAAGTSAGFAPLALGTETACSNVYPASKAGLYALRPTLGTICADGVYRTTKSFDGVGAMARTPLDLSYLVETILTPEAREKLPVNGFEDAVKGFWKGLRVGIAGPTWGSPNVEKWGSGLVKDKYDSVATKIRQHGGHAQYPIALPESATLEHDGIRFRHIKYHEFNTTIQEFCSGFENPKVRNRDDIIQFNEQHAELAMPEPHTDQKELLKCRDDTLSDEVSDEAHRQIRLIAGRDGLDRIMEQEELDVIVTNSDGELVMFAAFTGYPIATVPLGNLEDGALFGLFLIAKERREDLLFRFMNAFEKTFDKVAGPELN